MAPTKYPQLKDEAWLREQYIDQRKTMYDIAADLGCSDSLVYLALKATEIPCRANFDRVHGFRNKACEECSQEYKPTGPAQRFCSTECMNPLRHCEQCSIGFRGVRARPPRWSYYSHVFCSRDCREGFRCSVGRRRGRSHTPDGYVLVRVPEGKPGIRTGGYMLEHRWVMEQALGRPLESHETVHHINGEKTDNRLDNLQLRNGRHGKGVALECLECGSHNVQPVPLKGHGTIS